ncbi:MAG TPA: penicillin-binding protein activator [Sphingomonadaceae bacterium]|nr:penicillin-binding protein activator [Sphingomonadaceae bacterium]
MAEAVYPLQPARWFFKFAGLAAAVLLAGCQVVPKSGPSKAPPPVERPHPGTSTLPEDQARNRVALLVPLTGPNAGVGQSIANAANLAILDTGGKDVRVTTYDTATGAQAAAARALADGNRLILGPLLSEDVRAVAPAARAAHVPVLSFSNDIDVAGDGVYLLGYLPEQSIDRVVRYAVSKGMKRFAGLMPSGLYGRRASNALLKATEKAGAIVVSLDTYDRSPKSLSAAIAKIGAGQDYDALLIADGGRIALQAVPQVRKNGGGADAQILGTELWNTERSLAASPTLRGAWFASVPDGMYNQLAAKYRSRFGRAPYRLASLGYDSVLLAVRIGADWKPGTAFPVKRLLDKGGFAGVDGAFRFRPDGTAERALAVQQVGAGSFTVISPAPRSLGD